MWMMNPSCTSQWRDMTILVIARHLKPHDPVIHSVTTVPDYVDSPSNYVESATAEVKRRFVAEFPELETAEFRGSLHELS